MQIDFHMIKESKNKQGTSKLFYEYRVIFLISHWLKWSILNQSQDIKAKMRSFETEYQALRHIIPFI